MEKAAEMVSENLSETISRLNEERKVSNGLMAKGTALGIKVSELQDELERKDKELADTKVKLLDVLRNKPSDPALRSEIARLKGELELLKRNKFTSQCKECKRAAYRAKHGVKPVIKPPKPSVWDLTCMPKGLSVEDTVNLSNEAFPLLSNEYWKTGEAQKIYKQFGRKWSYL